MHLEETYRPLRGEHFKGLNIVAACITNCYPDEQLCCGCLQKNALRLFAEIVLRLLGECESCGCSEKPCGGCSEELSGGCSEEVE